MDCAQVLDVGGILSVARDPNGVALDMNEYENQLIAFRNKKSKYEIE